MKKPGPKKGNPAFRYHGAQGGKSRPSLKKSNHKQGARHGKPKRK
jgi:hypothetical protein